MNTYFKALQKYSLTVIDKTAVLVLGRALGLAVLWLYFPWWAFAVVALLIFIRSQNWPHNLFGFFVVIIALTWVSDAWLMSGLAGTPLIDVSYALRILFAALFGILFFLLFGIKELFFVRRREFCIVATTLAFFLTTFFTLWSLTPGTLILFTTPFAIAAFILGSSLSKFSAVESSASGVFIYFAIITFLMTELLWAFSYAPFSIVSSSILLTASFFLVNSLYFILEKDGAGL